MNRQDYIYELIGKIMGKDLLTNKKGTNHYRLKVIIPDRPEIKKINAFSDSLAIPKIWSEITKEKYQDKKYVFFCKNFMGSYYLIN